MKIEDYIDPDIFDVFIKNQVYLDYAQEFFDSEQVDDIAETEIPGYSN